MAEQNGRVMVVKSWHVLLTLLSWLVLAVLAYANVKYQTEENTRRVDQIEKERVRKEQFEDFREEMSRRLQRIEDKLDKQRPH